MMRAGVPPERWAEAASLVADAVTLYRGQVASAKLQKKGARRALTKAANAFDAARRALCREGEIKVTRRTPQPKLPDDERLKSVYDFCLLLQVAGATASQYQVARDALAAASALDRLATVARAAAVSRSGNRGHAIPMTLKKQEDGTWVVGPGAAFAANLAHLYRWATGKQPTAAPGGAFYKLVKRAFDLAGHPIDKHKPYVRDGLLLAEIGTRKRSSSS